MKKALIAVSIVLLIGLVGVAIAFAQNLGQTSQMEKQLAALNDEKQAMTKEKTDLTAEISTINQEKITLSTKVDTINGQTVSLQKDKDDLTKQVSDLTDKVSQLNKSLDQKTGEANAALQDKNKVTGKLMCTNPLSSVDFKNNQTVNDALAKYVESDKQMDEPISSKFWNVIWTNYNYSVHTISVHSEKDNMNYLWKFTVYFRGEDYGKHINAIFYNDHMCWLYREDQ